MALFRNAGAADGDVSRAALVAVRGVGVPSYETFWAAEIVPLTYRTIEHENIRFQEARELRAIGKSSEDVTVAQLHYTLLLHLGRVFDLLHADEFDRHAFIESFVALTGANDVGDELLQRRARPGEYEPLEEQAVDRRDETGDSSPAATHSATCLATGTGSSTAASCR